MHRFQYTARGTGQYRIGMRYYHNMDCFRRTLHSTQQWQWEGVRAEQLPYTNLDEPTLVG